MEIPNFAYTFGTYSGKLMIENIPGINFQKWIENYFNLDEYIRILYQVCLSLETARNNCDFYHNDLYPWNVMLKKDNRMKINYNIKQNSISIHNIKVLPVIIDYGRSSGKYLNKEYFLNKSSCNIQDILSLLLSSLHIIINKVKISNEQFKKLKILTEFFDPQYISKYITNNKIITFTDLRKFTERAKKYDEIIFGDKIGIKNKKIIHFREYLQNYFSDELKPLNIKYNDSISFRGEYNYKQTFDYISALNNQERYDSYINIFYGFKTSTLPQNKNKFLQCMIAINFEHNLFKLYNNYKTYQNFGNIKNRKMHELYNNCMYWIRNIYLENKGFDIGFQIKNNEIEETNKMQIMNVLFSKDSYLYKNSFYLKQFENII